MKNSRNTEFQNLKQIQFDCKVNLYKEYFSKNKISFEINKSYYDLALIYLGNPSNFVFKDEAKEIYYLKKSSELNHKSGIRKMKNQRIT